MKRELRDIWLTVVLAVLLPQIMIGITVMLHTEQPEIKEPEMETTSSPEPNRTVNVLFSDGTVAVMDMQDYLSGVILQEMPASFAEEAKKAQAVVARTYALRRCASDKHGGAVCTESTCCQAYISPSEYIENGGDQAAVDQALMAALETEDYVLTYDGALAEATYFSCSGGRTEEAVAVWGADIPYLQSVESPGEESAEHYVDTVTFKQGEFLDALGIEPNSDVKIGEIQHTVGGGVSTIEICENVFTGTQFRQLLGLRSTNFTITAVGSSITVTTRGFGHRVGMSQYGADAMARAGNGYQTILAHYYPGTVLEPWIYSETMQ